MFRVVAYLPRWSPTAQRHEDEIVFEQLVGFPTEAEAREAMQHSLWLNGTHYSRLEVVRASA